MVVTALLVVPSNAAAALGIGVIRNTLSVTGDDEPNEIRLTVGQQGNIAVNGTETTLPSGDGAIVNVATLGGADFVDASALRAVDYLLADIDGGTGNDVLIGGNGDESVVGGEGEDRLEGTPGSDFFFGAGGDDLMTWANGDGTDEHSGGNGTDETQLTGHPTASDVLFFRPSIIQFGWLLLRRQETAAAKAFEIELLGTETLSVNTLGGEDFTAQEGPEEIAGMAKLVLDGGSENDQLNGSDGDDDIQGGSGADLIFGEGGSDLLSDGAGSDAIIWEGGDGSDEIQASANDAGQRDQLFVLGSTDAGDQFELSREAQVTTLERTNLTPFRIATKPALGGDGSIEEFVVLAGGGDDEFVASPGMPGIRVEVEGDTGDDTLTGAEEVDSFIGGSDEDTLSPGPGADFIGGGDGDDRLLTRDGEADLLRGGAGNDSAETDALSLDDVGEVEVIDATPEDPGDPGDPGDDPGDPGDPPPDDSPPSDDPPAPENPPAQGDPPPSDRPAPPPPVLDELAILPTLGKLALAKSGGAVVVKVPVICPAIEAGGCRTTVTVETAKPVGLGARKAILRLGSATANLGPGARATVRVRLNRRAATYFERGKLPARLRIVSTDAAGNSVKGSATRVLQLPR